MTIQSAVSLFLLVAACLICATIKPARGLECYKSSWSDPASLTLNKTSTMVCSKPSFRFKRDDTTTAAASTGGNTTTRPEHRGDYSEPENNTSTESIGDMTTNTVSPETGDDHYCFSVTVKNETQKLGMERGCKLGKKEDDCITLDTTSKFKVEECTTCNKDKCNENGASTAGVSLHCVLLSTAIIVKMLFKNKA